MFEQELVETTFSTELSSAPPSNLEVPSAPIDTPLNQSMTETPLVTESIPMSPIHEEEETGIYFILEEAHSLRGAKAPVTPPEEISALPKLDLSLAPTEVPGGAPPAEQIKTLQEADLLHPEDVSPIIETSLQTPASNAAPAENELHEEEAPAASIETQATILETELSLETTTQDTSATTETEPPVVVSEEALPVSMEIEPAEVVKTEPQLLEALAEHEAKSSPIPPATEISNEETVISPISPENETPTEETVTSFPPPENETPSEEATETVSPVAPSNTEEPESGISDHHLLAINSSLFG